MNIKSSWLTLGLIAAMTGCIDSGSDDAADDAGSNGGGGGAATVERISFSGLVADGYLEGARVCLDIDNNKECGANEPTVITGAGGTFTMDEATQAQRDTYPLLVEVVVGTTIDLDNPGTALTKKLTLSAPVGYGFISPLTTMVQNEVEGGATSAAAEAAVQKKLGTTLSLDEDYVAGKASGTNADEYEKLHQVAQVTARVISDNMETLAAAATANSISLDDLISAIVDEVFDALDEIATQVEAIEESGETFDPDAVATDVNDELVDLAPETIDEQVDQNQAEEAAVEASLVAEMKAGGLNWMWAEINNSGASEVFEAEYGTIEFNVNNVFSDTIYSWNGSEFRLDESVDDNDTAYILNSSGEWVVLVGGNDDGTVTAEDDGSIAIEYGTAPNSYSNRLSGIEVDISGLNTRIIANQADDSDSIWGDYLLEDAVFPEGSKGYQLADAGSDEPYIFENSKHCVGNNIGGLCYVYLQDATGGNFGAAAAFSDITSATGFTLTGAFSTDVHGIKAVEIAYYDNGDKVWAEIVTAGNAVNYYKVTNGNAAITLLGRSTWAMVAGSSVAMELQPIASIQNLDSEFDDGNPVLAIINGAVRVASHELGGENNGSGVQFLNGVAIAAVIGSNFSLSNKETPVAEFCADGNSVWDGKLETITTQWDPVINFTNAITACSETDVVFTEATVSGVVSTGLLVTSSVATYLDNGRGLQQFLLAPEKNYWFQWSIGEVYSDGDLILDYTHPVSGIGEHLTVVAVSGSEKKAEYKILLQNDDVTAVATQQAIDLGFTGTEWVHGLIFSSVKESSNVNDDSTAMVAASFDADTIAGTYIWSCAEGDCTFVFNTDGTGTVNWPQEVDDTSSPGGYDDLLEWHVTPNGRLLVTLWSTLNNDGVTKDKLDAVERYTITTGSSQDLGTVTLEELGGSGGFVTAKMADGTTDVSLTWTKQ